MTLSNIIPLAQAMRETAVVTAWQAYQTAETNWIDSTISLALAMKELRDDFADNEDIAFGHRLDELGLRDINRDDRSALINMATHIDLTREVLHNTKRKSKQHIWREEIAPLVQAATTGAEIPSISQGDSDPSSSDDGSARTEKMTWSQKVAYLRQLRISDPGHPAAWYAVQAGFSGTSSSDRVEALIDHGIDTLIAAVDDGRVAMSRGCDSILRNSRSAPYNSPETQQQRLDEWLARTPATRQAAPTASTKLRRTNEATQPAPRRATAPPQRGLAEPARPRGRPALQGSRPAGPIVRFGPAIPGFAGAPHLTREQAGLPADATRNEISIFHQHHGMHPTETILGRMLSEDSREVAGFVTAVMGLANEIQALPDTDVLMPRIDRTLAHTPRPDIGHGEEQDYATKTREYLVILRERLAILQNRIESYQAIVRDRLTEEA